MDPKNDEYLGDLDAKSPIPLYFKCKKCKRNIWNHLYNEHIGYCGKQKNIGPKEGKYKKGDPLVKRKINLNISIQTGTKKRRTNKPPVGR